ncbi:hypothetical protein RF11_06535 [Thelohanellus kitauei]|uniref:Uncharacterized protein n=1 Tax=Thelohanellus kitauei TaxID=669202 RepID=A0A0C2IW75_THEKT|nr:hypothetical protein RF11_06535 [Thelohanellus kitauei]
MIVFSYDQHTSYPVDLRYSPIKIVDLIRIPPLLGRNHAFFLLHPNFRVYLKIPIFSVSVVVYVLVIFASCIDGKNGVVCSLSLYSIHRSTFQFLGTRFGKEEKIYGTGQQKHCR